MKHEQVSQSGQQQWWDLWYIVRRNVFLLTNGVIVAVAMLLFVFGDAEAGIFLGLVLIINMTLGLGQDIRAWYALRKLQLLTAPQVTRVLADGREETVLTEAIQKGDHLKLKTGDEVPCDGKLLTADSLELNEGLLTGEATSFVRQTGDHVLAGSIITAGVGVLLSEVVFEESRIARMTEGIQGYSASESPIQRSVNQVIQYAGYLLVGIILFITLRGFLVGEPRLIVVKNIGALASTVVPQGLAFALTLLFAYGAAHLYRRQVLLQEVNATEKLGRIKNLCMDKTGTLTENRPTVERALPAPFVSETELKALMAAYGAGAEDHSQTMEALREFSGTVPARSVRQRYAFSSARSYGMLDLEKTAGGHEVLVLGAPDVLGLHLHDDAERAWLAQAEQEGTKEGFRMIALARLAGDTLPTDLTDAPLSCLGVFVLTSKLRPGIPEAIQFFQERGVHIRIISGDHPETVRTVAGRAGVQRCEQLITGKEMEQWGDEDFAERAKQYSIFARIFPEQKEKIIAALKSDGFTAMVGDGANDALAIKRADLGIAMFEGAPATRKLASVVLLNNSFTALPGGVELAESIIKNAEIFASIFFGAAVNGLVLFFGVSALGYHFPLTPLNITLINYFVIGFPGILVSYWTLRPSTKAPVPHAGNFLKRVALYTLLSATLQATILLMVFVLSPTSLKSEQSNFWMVAISILTGSVFFLFAPAVYRGRILWRERRDMILLILVEIFFCFFFLRIPLVRRFFEVEGLTFSMSLVKTLVVSAAVYMVLQWGVAQWLKRRFTGH